MFFRLKQTVLVLLNLLLTLSFSSRLIVTDSGTPVCDPSCLPPAQVAFSKTQVGDRT